MSRYQNTLTFTITGKTKVVKQIKKGKVAARSLTSASTRRRRTPTPE